MNFRFFQNRFSRRAALAGLIAAALGGASWSAHAHGGWHRGGFSDDPAKMEAGIDRMLDRMYSRIEATEEQKAKITPLVKNAAKEVAPLRQKAREARAKAVELLKAPAVDRAALESLRAEQIQAHDQASRRFSQVLADVAEVLTPAQRAQVAERLQSRHGRWHRG
jgi:Spy/CpxP family protein refolding chaperone